MLTRDERSDKAEKALRASSKTYSSLEELKAIVAREKTAKTLLPQVEKHMVAFVLQLLCACEALTTFRKIVAAMDTLFGSLETTPDEDWMGAMQTNVVGTLHAVKAAVPLLREGGGGSVVLVGSRSQWFPPGNPQIAYASSKGALLSSMYHMVNEFGPDKIRVNMVVPTWMWGPPVQMFVKWQASERGIAEEEVVREITDGMPLGDEIPADDDVAEAIVFFCSDRARMITGETLQVNSGEFFR